MDDGGGNVNYKYHIGDGGGDEKMAMPMEAVPRTPGGFCLAIKNIGEATDRRRLRHAVQCTTISRRWLR